MHTFKPRSTSFNERFISLVSVFILSHSCKATNTYGVFSSARTNSSSMLNSSESFSRNSSRMVFTW